MLWLKCAHHGRLSAGCNCQLRYSSNAWARAIGSWPLANREVPNWKHGESGTALRRLKLWIGGRGLAPTPLGRLGASHSRESQRRNKGWRLILNKLGPFATSSSIPPFWLLAFSRPRKCEGAEVVVRPLKYAFCYAIPRLTPCKRPHLLSHFCFLLHLPDIFLHISEFRHQRPSRLCND